ncbi:hypothetical protein Tco_0797645 [Tanacetum coccineum]
MDDPNITIEEYIELYAKKARRRADFPSIVYNDALTSNENVSPEPTISIYNAIKTDFDFSISFSDSDDEDYTFICDKDSFSYKLNHVDNLKPEPVNDHVEINTELCLENIDIKPMDSVVCISSDTTPVESDEQLEANQDEISELSETNNFFLIIRMISRISFNEGKPLILVIENIYVPFGILFDPKQFYKDGVYTKRLWRPRQVNRVHILDFAGLEEKMRQALTDRLRMVHTRVKDQVLFTSDAWRRLFEIQGPLDHEFMLEFFSTCRIDDTKMGLDTADTLCFQYAEGRKRGARLSGGHFVGRVIEHFRLHICERLGDTWVWVAPGPERQQVAAARALEDVKGAHAKVEGNQAILKLVQAPQSPSAAALVVRTMH